MSPISLQERFVAHAWRVLTDTAIPHSKQALLWALEVIGQDTAGGRDAAKRLRSMGVLA
jgi:hypothetical protein